MDYTQVFNHLLISRCDSKCDWSGPSIIVTPDVATQQAVENNRMNIECTDNTDGDVINVERVDANWLSVLYAKYMESQHYMPALNTDAEKETTTCAEAQGFDYTYIVDNTISQKNSNR